MSPFFESLDVVNMKVLDLRRKKAVKPLTASQRQKAASYLEELQAIAATATNDLERSFSAECCDDARVLLA